MAFYSLFVPKQTVAANTVFFDLFNASGSGVNLKLHQVTPVVSNVAAVTGVITIDLFLTRTTAVGTSGTAATSEGSSLTACTFSGIDNQQALPPAVTARLTPTGGATAGAVLDWFSATVEETNAASGVGLPNMARPGQPDIPAVIIPQGTGVRVVEGGTTTSVGTIGFNVVFETQTTT